jgi:hypothetical protein
MREIIAMFTVAIAGFAVVPQVAVGAFIKRVSVCPSALIAGNSLPPLACPPSLATNMWGAGLRSTAAEARLSFQAVSRPTATALVWRLAPTGATWPSDSDASNLVPGDTNHAEDVFAARPPLPGPGTRTENVILLSAVVLMREAVNVLLGGGGLAFKSRTCSPAQTHTPPGAAR